MLGGGYCLSKKGHSAMSGWTIATLCLPVVSLVFGFFSGHFISEKNSFRIGRRVMLVAAALLILFNPYFSVFTQFSQVTDPVEAARLLFNQVLVFAVGAGFWFGGWIASRFGNLNRLT